VSTTLPPSRRTETVVVDEVVDSAVAEVVDEEVVEVDSVVTEEVDEAVDEVVSVVTEDVVVDEVEVLPEGKLLCAMHNRVCGSRLIRQWRQDRWYRSICWIKGHL
jgi:hypothetical protein